MYYLFALHLQSQDINTDSPSTKALAQAKFIANQTVEKFIKDHPITDLK